MRKFLIPFAAALAVCACSQIAGDSFPRTDKYAEFSDSYRQVYDDVWADGVNELHSIMILKDGEVIFEKYAPTWDADRLHVMWSATKTFSATAIGFAVQEGLLSVEDKLIDLIPEYFPEEVSAALADVSVWNLLTMSSGLVTTIEGRPIRAVEEKDWAREILAAPMVFEPGWMFEYNSMGSYMLSVVLEKVAGEKMSDYLEKRLFAPLGIRDYYWEESPQGFTIGGWGLYLSIDSFARMGQFFLQKGMWKGKRILDEKWFDAAMSPQILPYRNRTDDPALIAHYKANDDWNQGYGYQMWCCRHGAYRLDGAWGQFCIILPDKNAVVAIQSHSSNAAMILNSVWDNVLTRL